MKRKCGFLTLLACAALISINGTKSSGAQQEGSPEASKRNQDAVLDNLLPVVFASGKAVRLYYRSDCRAATNRASDAVPFPFVKVQPPSKGKTGLDAIREIFQNDKNVTVTEESKGIVRIRIGNVPTEILQTKLPLLHLNPNGQYNPDEVFNSIVKTREMKSAMRSLKFQSVWNPSSTQAEPDHNFPHLPATIRNMTAEQVLDKVAQTWRELVVMYGACAEPTEVDGERRFWLGVAGQY
jgi:hypothetical protein